MSLTHARTHTRTFFSVFVLDIHYQKILAFVFFTHKRKHSVAQSEARPGSDQGPVVQSVVSLTSSLRVISLTVLADSIHNILIFFAEKM